MKKNKESILSGKSFYISLAVGVIAVFAVSAVSTNVYLERQDNVQQQAELPEHEPTEVAEIETQPMLEEDVELSDMAENPTAELEGEAYVQETDVVDETDDSQMAQQSDDEMTEVAEAADETTEEVADEAVAEDTGDAVETAQEETAVAVAGTGENVSGLTFNEEDGLQWPIQGEVLMNYSMDKSVYFKTLAQYKCNPAILIQGEEGQEVVSAATGVITDIVENEETGTTVTMSIGGDYTLVYGQLTSVAYEVGDTVEEGQQLGILAEPTKYYVEEGTNLYFMVKEGDDTVDPMLLLR